MAGVALDFRPLERYGDFWSDAVVSGALPATSATLTTTIPAQTLYLAGLRVTTPATSNAFGPSTTTYVDATPAGSLVFTTGVLAASNMRLFSVVTSATAVTAVNDLRRRHPLEDYISGLSLNWNAPGTNMNNLSVSSGAAYVPAVNEVVVVPSAISPPAAAFAASTSYYCYLYVDASGNPQVELSTQAPATSPYRGTARVKGPDPAPDNSRRYLGMVRSDGSATPKMWSFLWLPGGLVRYREGYLQAPFLVASNLALAANTLTTISFAGAVPPTSRQALSIAYVTQACSFGTSDGAAAAVSGTFGQTYLSILTSWGLQTWFNLDSSQTLNVMMGAAGNIYLAVLGYLEVR